MTDTQYRDAIKVVRHAVAVSKPVCMDDKTFSEMTESELARVHQWQRMVHALMAGLGVAIVEVTENLGGA